MSLLQRSIFYKPHKFLFNCWEIVSACKLWNFVSAISLQKYFLCSQELFGLHSQVLNIETTSGGTPQHIPLRPLRTWPCKHFRNQSSPWVPQTKTRCLWLKCLCGCAACNKKTNAEGRTKTQEKNANSNRQQRWEIMRQMRGELIYSLFKPSSFSARPSSSLYFWSSRYSWEGWRKLITQIKNAQETGFYKFGWNWMFFMIFWKHF